MVALRLRPGRSRPGQRQRDEQSAILNGFKKSIVAACVAFLALAVYAKLGISQMGTQRSKSSTGPRNYDLIQNLDREPDTAKSFVEKNCDLGAEDWWAPEKHEAWKKRAPAFLVIGAKKCGTTSLHRFLMQHPSITKARVKELLFFIPMRFPCWEDPDDYESKIMVESAREFMYETDYPVGALQDNDGLLSFEATPDYLVYSTFSAKAILCTIPWVKIIVTLRDPVDRLFSHYSFLTDPLTGGQTIERMGGQITRLSFEQFVQQNMKQLQHLGVVAPNHTVAANYMGSPDETNAWRAYQKIPNGQVMDRPIARSLYAIQLEEWFDALRAIGRDPAESVLVVQEEDLKEDAQGVANRIFDWLGLPPATVENARSGMITHYSSQMKDGTRSVLESFFKPYNERLYKLLGKEWDGIWEKGYVRPPPIVLKEFVMQEPNTPPASIDHVPAEWNSPEKSFLERFCDLGEEKAWWPNATAADAWKLRAPYFMLIGAKKGGTSSIYKYLVQHPLIRSGRTKELHSFQQDFFPQWKNRTNIGTKVHIDVARADIYREDYPVEMLKSHPKFVSFDATPDYLLYSTFSAQAILCTTPWVKILVSLRNPIDRVFSHYNFIMDDILMPTWFVARRRNQTFDEYVEMGMEKMRTAGIVQTNISQQIFFGSDEEKQAWREYQKRAGGSDHPISRSLYALQLEEWFDWFQEIGRDPSEILIVRQEDLKSDPHQVLDSIVSWLDLPQNNFKTDQNIMVTHYTRQMNPETRKKLETFFTPYNKRLYKLLGEEWNGVWD